MNLLKEYQVDGIFANMACQLDAETDAGIVNKINPICAWLRHAEWTVEGTGAFTTACQRAERYRLDQERKKNINKVA